MCGIVGIAGKITKDARDAFDQMLLVCQLRGKHAAGAIAIKKNNERDWFKVIGVSNNILEHKKYIEMTTAYDKKVFIGHCRAATVGNVDDPACAHPFEHDHIVGVHNGTLAHTYRWKLDQGRELPVDSSALFYNIAKHGPEITFGSIDGAWACVWWDREQKTVNFLRNRERPLYIAHSEDNELMFWASEPWMLLLAERNGIKLGRDDKGNWATPLPCDELWTIEVDANCKKGDKVFKAKIKKVEGEAPVYSRTPFLTATGEKGTVEKRKDFPFLKPGDKPPKPGSLVKANPFIDDEIPAFMQPNVNQESSLSVTPPDTTPKAVESGTTNSPIITLGSSTAKASGSTPNSSTSTSPTKASSPRKNLLTLPRVSKSDTNEGSNNTSMNVLPFRRKTIHRKVHGVGYVTDIDGDEVEEKTMWKKSGGQCCFCKQTVNNVNDIAEVYDKGESILCVPCITDWDMSEFKSKGM